MTGNQNSRKMPLFSHICRSLPTKYPRNNKRTQSLTMLF